MSLDYEQLKDEVIEYWSNNCVDFTQEDREDGPNIPPGGHSETSIKEMYQAILDDPILCIEELGFSSLSDYIESKSKAKNVSVGVQLGYCRISKFSTKFFFQSAGRDLEFYIDRDPNTSVATLWIRPGYTEATQAFLGALTLEYRRAILEAQK